MLVRSFESDGFHFWEEDTGASQSSVIKKKQLYSFKFCKCFKKSLELIQKQNSDGFLERTQQSQSSEDILSCKAIPGHEKRKQSDKTGHHLVTGIRREVTS